MCLGRGSHRDVYAPPSPAAPAGCVTGIAELLAMTKSAIFCPLKEHTGLAGSWWPQHPSPGGNLEMEAGKDRGPGGDSIGVTTREFTYRLTVRTRARGLGAEPKSWTTHQATQGRSRDLVYSCKEPGRGTASELLGNCSLSSCLTAPQGVLQRTGRLLIIQNLETALS